MVTERHGPSRSQQTNQLIALCQDVLDGRAAPEVLQQALEAREQGLLAARSDFLQKSTTEGEKFAQDWAEPIQSVLEAFDQYGVALGTARMYLSGRRAEQFNEAMGLLAQAGDALLGALDAYDARFLVYGPTPYPVLNMLINTTDQVRAGTMERAPFARMMAETRTYFTKCIDEAQGMPADTPREPVARLVQGFRMQVEGITQIERFLEDANPAWLDQGVETSRQAQALISEGFTDLHKQTYESGPTTSPIANTYIAAAKMAREGRYDLEKFEEAVDKLDEHLRDVRRGFEALCQVPTESVMIQEEIPKVLEAFDMHEEANAAFRRFLTSGDPLDIDEGVAKLEESMRRLDASKGHLEQASSQQGKILCTHCFTANEPHERVCQSCNAALPRMEHLIDGANSTFKVGETGAAESTEEPVMTEHLARIIVDTNQVAEGKMSDEQYVETLQWMEAILLDAEQKLAAQPFINPEAFPDDDRDKVRRESAMLEDTKEMLREGIENTRVGLAQLALFLDDRNQEHLIEGLRTIWDASRQVLQVQRIGEMAAKAVRENEEKSDAAETTRLDDEVELEVERD